jgi:hypothetical protein
MEEAQVRQQLYRTLRDYGYWPLRGRDASICPQCHTKIVPPIGRPDIIVLAPRGIGRVVEVKAVNMLKDKSFSFSSITPEQRKWLSTYALDGGLGYLAIGAINVRPMRLWVIDWDKWMDIEESVSDIQMSIPVTLDGKFKREMVDNNLSLELVAKSYELDRVKTSWRFPRTHSMVKDIIINEPN